MLKKKASKERFEGGPRVPEERPGVSWAPKGGYFDVSSHATDIIFPDLSSIPSDPFTAESTRIARGVLDAVFERADHIAGGRPTTLENVGAAIDQTLDPDFILAAIRKSVE